MTAAAIIIIPAKEPAYKLTAKGRKAAPGILLVPLGHREALLSTLARIQRREWRA